MPTPIYAIRLSRETREALSEMARVYGSSSPAEFIRVMLTAICSGDAAKIAAFNRELFGRMGEQLTLDLLASQPAEKPAPQALPAPRKGGGGGKGRKAGKGVRGASR